MNETFAQKRLQAIKKLPTEDPEFLTALNYVSGFYSQNNSLSRKNLKDNLEERHLQCNVEFLQSFDSLLDEILRAEEIVSELKNSCQQMKDQVDKTQENSERIISYIDELQTRKEIATTHHQVTTAFIERFQLSESEVRLLRTGEIGKSFFDALSTARRITVDCHQLLRTQTQSSDLYLEIGDQVAEIERVAVDRLYRWTTNSISSLSSDIVEFPTDLRNALKALEARGAFYQLCIKELEKVRAALLAQNFLLYLERGGQEGGIPKSIDLDPVRYVGDMLAFIHQSIATEWELLDGLFHEKYDLEQALANITSSLCPLLFDRVSRVVEDVTSVTVLFQIANVFYFYSSMLSNYLGSSSLLHGLFGRCQDVSLKGMIRILHRKSDNLMLTPPIPPSDGSPALSIQEQMSELEKILKLIFSSLEVSDEREKIVSAILNAVVQPLVQICQLSATGLDEAHMSVYLLNCLGLLDTSLTTTAESPSVVHQREKIGAQIEAYLDTTIQVEGRYLIEVCHLGDLWGRMSPFVLKKKRIPGKLAEVPGLDPNTLEKSLREFEASLFTDSIHQMPTLARIQSLPQREKARVKALDAVVNTYSCIYDAINDSNSGYLGSGMELLKYRVDQIRTILNA